MAAAWSLATTLASARWAEWRPATCLPDACFCEAIRAGWVRQPVNAASSLAFVAVAGAVLWQQRTDGRRAAGMPGGSATMFAVALLVIGVGSAFYHASLTFAGQFVDVLGMYLLSTFIIFHNIRRLRPLSDRALVTAYVAANSALAWALYALPAFRRHIFGVLLLAGVVLAVRARPKVGGDARVLGAAVLLFAGGFLFWTLDFLRVGCHPASVAQGHALWHIAGAGAAWLLFRYFAAAPRTAGAPPARGQAEP